MEESVGRLLTDMFVSVLDIIEELTAKVRQGIIVSLETLRWPLVYGKWLTSMISFEIKSKSWILKCSSYTIY